MNLILGFMGPAGVGKTTTANAFLEYAKSSRTSAQVIGFADELKRQTADIFNVDINDLYSQKGKESLRPEINMDEYVSQMCEKTGLNIQPCGKQAISYRQLLQYFGTEYVRGVDEEYWLKKTISQCYKTNLSLIHDLRFENEIAAVIQNGGVAIQLRREGVFYGNVHASDKDMSSLADLILDLNGPIALDMAGKIVQVARTKAFNRSV